MSDEHKYLALCRVAAPRWHQVEAAYPVNCSALPTMKHTLATKIPARDRTAQASGPAQCNARLLSDVRCETAVPDGPVR